MLKIFDGHGHVIRNLNEIKKFYERNLNVKGIFTNRWRYRQNWNTYKCRNTRETFKLHNKNKYMILGEWNEQAGRLGSYFWQDLWAAQHIYQDNPVTHYDIGSRVDGFIGHLCSFRKNIIIIDVRPFDKGSRICTRRCKKTEGCF